MTDLFGLHLSCIIHIIYEKQNTLEQLFIVLINLRLGGGDVSRATADGV